MACDNSWARPKKTVLAPHAKTAECAACHDRPERKKPVFRKILKFARDESGAANVDFIVLTSVIVSIALLSFNAVIVTTNEASAGVAKGIYSMGEAL
jgi:Flp pilus assembly pilin Flp